MPTKRRKRTRSAKKVLKHELKKLAIALSMVPICWLAIFVYCFVVAPAPTAADPGRNWDFILIMTFLVGTLAGVIATGAVYAVLGMLLVDER